jgi:anti-sigma28 factor (negative regulator of flagellin synthesis)
MQNHSIEPVPDPPSTSRSASPKPDKKPAESVSAQDAVPNSTESDSEENSPETDERALRLARIKAAIEAGDYETQDKLDAALSRLFDEIGLDEDG